LSPGRISIVDELLPFAGIATVADMMPMLDENRQLVRLSLEAINSCKFNNETDSSLYKVIYALGAANFIKSNNAVATEDLISFSIAPAINAVSRVTGDVSEVVEKIIHCLGKPWAYIPSYIKLNYARQKMSKEVFSDFTLDESYKNSQVFVYNPEDYEYNIRGILGLIASKATNKHKIIALVGVRRDDGGVEFSGRSTPNYNLHEGISRIKEMFPEMNIEGGGHSMAMGVRIKNATDENLKIFREALEEDIEKYSEPYISRVFEWEPEMETEILETVYALQPYGTGFNQLTFTYSGVFLEYDTVSKTALIGDYKFRMFIANSEIEDYIGTDITVQFNISFNSTDGPIFNVISE
jgi:single-stranded-DNA-specific exonuclease